MARRAFLLGGSGQTGRALIPRLQELSWDVIVGSRGERELPPGVEHVAFDRNVPGALEAAIGQGADVVVDFAALEPAHAEQLLALEGRVGSLVLLSSAPVYFPHRSDALPPPPASTPRTAETIAP